MSELPPPGGAHPVLGNRWTTLLLNVIVLVLILLALFLPPVSLGRRPTPSSSPTIESRIWSAADPDGAELTVVAVELPDDKEVALELTSVPRADLLAGDVDEAYQVVVQAVPSYLAMKSPLYEIRFEGTVPSAATMYIPIPNDAEPWHTLDVYGWSGDRWYWLDGLVREAQDDILVRMESLPEAVAVMQTQQRELVLSAPLPAGQALSGEQLDILAEVYPYGGLVAEDGSILTEPSVSPSAVSGVRVMPSIRNWADGGRVWLGRVDRIVNDEKLRKSHVNTLRQFVVRGGYDGVDIDYRDLVPESRAAFGQFVDELAQALHPLGKLVSVRVSLPVAIAPKQWDTGSYDWPALSPAVDVLRVPMPVDPRIFAPDGRGDAFLDWAVDEADRYKLQFAFTSLAVEQAEDTLRTLSYTQALALLSRVEAASLPKAVASGEEVFLELPVLRRSSGLLYDETLHTWWFVSLDERDQERVVWLNNAEGLFLRAALAASYHLRGITVEGLMDDDNDPNLWAAVSALGSEAEPPVAKRFSLQWQTAGPDGLTVVDAPLVAESAFYTWRAPSTGGAYEIAVAVAQDDQPIVMGEPLMVSVGGAVAIITPTPAQSPVPTPTPQFTPAPTGSPRTPTPTPTPTPTRVAPTATPTPTTTPTSTPRPTRIPPTVTPTFTPAYTPTPELLEPPVLFEPESGAGFSKEVRLKWTWYRQLEDDEKFAVRWAPTSGQEVGDWWVSEVGIIGGGGAIYAVEGGYLFEVNMGLGPYPGGEAYWSVAVFGETLTEKWQISQWSEGRQIFRGVPPK